MGRNLPNASTFVDLNAATLETQANLDAHATGIQWWLAHSTANQIVIENGITDAANASVFNQAAGGYIPARTVITVLIRDPSVPNGFTVYTSYANP